jgi:hypothetical protein
MFPLNSDFASTLARILYFTNFRVGVNGNHVLNAIWVTQDGWPHKVTWSQRQCFMRVHGIRR